MLRLICGLFLAFALSATSVTAAVMRGQMAGASELVICSGGAMASVVLDATGRKVDAPHHCPLCVAAGGAALPVWQTVTRPVTRSVTVWPALAVGPVGGIASGFAARGPPRGA